MFPLPRIIFLKMQIRQLERTTSGDFDYIEDLIERENTFTMEQFASSISKFLTFREYNVLVGKGHVSRKAATAKEESEYPVFNKTQKIISDFNKEVKRLIESQ